MGFATNQTEQSIRVFCQSLRSVYDQEECDLIVLTNRYEDYFEDLTRLGVRFESTTNNYSMRTSKIAKLINRILLQSFRALYRLNRRRWVPEITDAYQVLIETWHHPQLARWFAYQRILRVNQIYRQIFVADVKDIVFQAPFFSTSPDIQVMLFADANLYGECYWNDRWIKEAYGSKGMSRVLGRQPVCIGTLLGSQSAMLSLLDEFTAKMSTHPFGRIEQAIFNYMVHTDEFRTQYSIAPNVAGIVSTLASEAAYERVQIIGDEICRVSDRSVIPVIHMYDRWPATLSLCSARFTGAARSLVANGTDV
jgi:hypothetical protein